MVQALWELYESFKIAWNLPKVVPSIYIASSSDMFCDCIAAPDLTPDQK